MNIQFAVKDGEVYVLEVNPRASPDRAVRLQGTGDLAGRGPGDGRRAARRLGLRRGGPRHHVSVKEAVFPFAKFPGVDIVLGPEMRSTGEVMGIDRDFAAAFAKSQLGGRHRLPRGGTVFVSVKDGDKPWVRGAARQLLQAGFSSSPPAARPPICGEGLPVEHVKKVLEGRPHIVDPMKNGEVQLVFNTTEGRQSLADSFSLRRKALMMRNALLHHPAGGARRSCRP